MHLFKTYSDYEIEVLFLYFNLSIRPNVHSLSCSFKYISLHMANTYKYPLYTIPITVPTVGELFRIAANI